MNNTSIIYAHKNIAVHKVEIMLNPTISCSFEDVTKTTYSHGYRVDFSEPLAEKKIFDSLKDNRFVILKNHEVNTRLLQNVYETWSRFFNDKEKLSLFRSDVEDEGYVPVCMETAAGSNVADMKEYYQTHVRGLYPDYIECSSTKEILNEFINLGSKVIRILDENIPTSVKKNINLSLADTIHNCDRHGFRIIHYPPIVSSLQESPRAGAHTDICLLTMIPFATAEGLELEDSAGVWHKPHIDKDEILIFNADMLEMATNGYIKSAMHRVVVESGPKQQQSRFSFPVFIHPRREVELQPNVTAMDALRKRITEIGFNGDLLQH